MPVPAPGEPFEFARANCGDDATQYWASFTCDEDRTVVEVYAANGCRQPVMLTLTANGLTLPLPVLPGETVTLDAERLAGPLGGAYRYDDPGVSWRIG